MINYFIIALLWIIILLSAVSAIAEMIFRRNSKPYRFFRAIWIRLREFSPFNFTVTVLLLLFWGLVSGDDNFYGIWMAAAMMLTVVVILYAQNLFTFRKKRKKASKAAKLPSAAGKKASAAKETPLANKTPVLTPITPGNGQ